LPLPSRQPCAEQTNNKRTARRFNLSGVSRSDKFIELKGEPASDRVKATSPALTPIHRTPEFKMDEAIRSIPLQPRDVIVTLAKQAAIKAVKRELRAQGIELYQFAQREIVAMAREYLVRHRQRLVEEAAETVRKVPELRTLHEREQRDRRRNRQ
jgi:hypothetical protein